MKFGALQQSYKLLKSQNEDLTDEAEHLRTTHLEEIAALEAKSKNSADMHDKELELVKVNIIIGFNVYFLNVDLFAD